MNRLYSLNLILFCVLLSWTGQAFSQDTLSIDTVAVRTTRAAGISPRLSTRIDGQQLAAMPVHSADDYLDYLPWLDLRSRGTLGVQGDLSIRGAGYEQTLILLDGVPMVDAQTGHHNLNLPLPMEMIGGIEVIASGASRVFGPKAMAGSVNFTTKLPEKTGGWASVNGGEFGFFRAAGGISLYKNSRGIAFSAQSMGSNGYMPNTDFLHNSYFLQLYQKTKTGKLWANAMLGNKRFGAQNFYSAAFPYQQEYTNTGIVTLNWEAKKGLWSFNANASLRTNTDRFELYREGRNWYNRAGKRYVRGTDTTPTWYAGHNYHKNSSYGIMANATRKMGIHFISIGAEARNETVLSNVLGEPINTRIPVPFGSAGDSFTREANRQNISVYVEDKIEWRKWNIAAGILLNNNSMFGSDIYPGMEVSYNLNSRSKLFANVNRSNRFPTYTDLYYNRGGAVGSKDLKPEEAISYELGYTRRSKQMSIQAAGFLRDGKNLIDWVRLPGSAVTTATNLTNVLFYGADAMLAYKPGGEAGKYFSRITLGGFLMGADNNSNGFESNYALDFIKNKFTLSADVILNKNMQLSLIAYRQHRKGGYLQPGQTFETRFEPLLSADFRWTFGVDGWKIYAEAANLFNAAVMDLGNVQLPGRWIRAGLSVNF